MDPELEKKLASQAQSGDQEAFMQLVEHYKSPVFNLIYRMTSGSQQETDDLAQETFLRCLKGLPDFDLQKRFFPWLYTVCLNVIRNHMRKKQPIPWADNMVSDLATEEESGNPEYLYLQRQKNDLVQKCLLQLPEEQRAAIIFKYFQELTYDDIAQILGLSASGVKMRVKRGLEKLHAELSKHQ